MARPQKHNADYFPHDSDLRNDRRSKALRNKFGTEGYGIFIMLLEALIQAEYFELPYNSLEIELLAGDFDVDTNKLSGIIQYLLDIELLEHKEERISSPLHADLKTLLFQNREKERKRKSEGKPVQTDVFHTENQTTNTQEEVLQAENPNSEIVFRAENTQTKLNETKVNEKKENIIQGYKEISPISENFKNKEAPTENLEPEIQKEKGCAQKEKNVCKDFFLKQVKTYYWEAKDDEHISQLLQKIKATNPHTGTINCFQQLIINLPAYWRSKKFTIQHLNLNFNEIMNEIQAKKQSIQVHAPIIQPSYTHHTGSIQSLSVNKTPELSEEQKQEVQRKFINRVCEEYQNYCKTGNFNIWPVRLVYDLFIREKIVQLTEEQLKIYEVRAIEQRKLELSKPKNRNDKFSFKTILESYTNGIDASEQNKIEKIKQELAVMEFLADCKIKNIELKNLFKKI